MILGSFLMILGAIFDDFGGSKGSPGFPNSCLSSSVLVL